MLAVIRLRLLGLKEDYKIMFVMAVLALGMVYAFSSQNSGSYERIIQVTDLENSTTSGRFVSELDQFKDYQVVLVNEKQGREAISNDNGLAHIILPVNFSSALRSGKVNLTFVSTKNDVDTMSLKNSITGVLSNIQANLIFSERTAKAISEVRPSIEKEELANSIYTTADQRYKLQNPYSVKESSFGSSGRSESQTLHSFFGFTLLFSAYSIVFGIGEILNDKAYNTWDRLLQSPVTTASILFGNTFTTLIVGLIQVAIIFIGGQVLFGIEFGSALPLVLLVSFAFIFSLTGLGLFLASILKNHSQLSAVTPIILTSFAMLGGCMWPLEIVTSRILLGLSTLTPHRWALEALENIMIKGIGVSSIYMPITILFTMGLMYLGVGGWMIGRGQTK